MSLLIGCVITDGLLFVCCQGSVARVVFVGEGRIFPHLLFPYSIPLIRNLPSQSGKTTFHITGIRRPKIRKLKIVLLNKSAENNGKMCQKLMKFDRSCRLINVLRCNSFLTD